MSRLAWALACVIAASAAHAGPADMVLITNGVYRPLLRSATEPAEAPVKAFYLDVLPVTVKDYLEFVRTNPRWRRSRATRLFADESYLKNWVGDLDSGPGAPADSPVTYVSWFAAKAYAQWKGKRLPTVAEWECAASETAAGGQPDPQLIARILQWYSKPTPAVLPSVGMDAANGFGLHNLHGLVWEWVADFNSALISGDAAGNGAANGRFVCGGASQGARDVEDYPAFMRSAFRSSLRGDYCIRNLGFRCAHNL
jgi:formylglycine-generating enzyme required for sulfatase activity